MRDGAAFQRSRRVPLFLDIFHLNINLTTARERKWGRRAGGQDERTRTLRPRVPCNRRGASRREFPSRTRERESRFSRALFHRSDLCSHVCASIIAISAIKRTGPSLSSPCPSRFRYFTGDAERDVSSEIISAASEFISRLGNVYFIIREQRRRPGRKDNCGGILMRFFICMCMRHRYGA